MDLPPCKVECGVGLEQKNEKNEIPLVNYFLNKNIVIFQLKNIKNKKSEKTKHKSKKTKNLKKHV